MYNVLDTEEQGKLRKIYRMRLAIVSMVMISFVFLSGAIGLVPSVLQTFEKKKEYDAELAFLKKGTETGLQSQYAETIKTVNEQVKVLSLLNVGGTPHEAIEKVIEKKGDGIILTQISYEPVGTSSTMRIEGVATKLENLLRFQEALLTIAPYTKAEIPIDLLSKSRLSNIRFNLKLE